MSAAPPSDTPSTFADLGLRPELVEALSGLGYEEPTPVQREAVPPLLEGRDVLGQAATGTGKTAAFALPLLHRLPEGERGGPSALVLAPTRELAVQVSEAVHRYGRGLGARVLPVYGGQPIGRQLAALARGVDVVVATPGRAVDHLQRGSLRLADVQTVVLDEADEMLDMGFAEDLDRILEALPEQRQTVLFSATLPQRIGGLARRHLRDPVRITIAREAPVEGEAPRVRQSAYVVPRAAKPAALGRVLDLEQPTAALVFCRTREEVDSLTETLNGRGYRAEALHGGMGQEQRDRVMGRLRAGTADLLVATDVAARGLDVEQLSHVVNYTVPSSAETYVHRIGRVGRAGREGVAVTLAEPREHRMLKTIERVTGSRIVVEKVPTVADLQARRLELTRAALRESLLSDQLDRFRPVVEQLSDEFDVVEVALAAVKLAHEATRTSADDDEEIPEAPVREERGRRDHRGRAEPARPAKTSEGMARLFVGLGRSAGMRPQDLVGAIAGESQLRGKDVGAIEISERFSLVEVPEGAADDVVVALRGSVIRGRRPTVRRQLAHPRHDVLALVAHDLSGTGAAGERLLLVGRDGADDPSAAGRDELGEQEPDPEPGPGELLVDVEAAGVNFIDIYQREGRYPVPLPSVAGSEAAGTVRAVGDGVDDVRPGDRVAWAMVRGTGYATAAVVPAERAVPVPDGVSTEQAAAVLLQGMTAHFLCTATHAVQPGEDVLVHAAAGGVGLLLTQLVTGRGGRVIGTVSTDEKEALARGAGAAEVVRYEREDVVARVRELTGGRGVPVVYDGVGRSTFEGSLDCLARRGILVLFGASSGAVPPLDPMALQAHGSAFLTRPTLGDYVADRAELVERASAVLGAVRDGRLDVRIGGRYALADAGRAHEDLQGRRTTGKCLLLPR